MFKFVTLCILSLLFLSSPAFAKNQSSGFFSGAYLAALCQSDEKGNEIVSGGHTACQAYIAGVIDYHKLLQSLSTQPAIDFCVPNAESPKNLQKVVAQYLRRNPQHAQFIAAPSVTLALAKSYPCKKKK